jgi:uncharacterized membrane protein YozB (DUF420 family)
MSDKEQQTWDDYHKDNGKGRDAKKLVAIAVLALALIATVFLALAADSIETITINVSDLIARLGQGICIGSALFLVLLAWVYLMRGNDE